MNHHRLSTDRKEAVVVAGCPDGCQAFELETEGREAAVDELIETVESAFDKCSKCGQPIGVLRQEEPTEVLE